jgi:Homeodomain-like domain
MPRSTFVEMPPEEHRQMLAVLRRARYGYLLALHLLLLCAAGRRPTTIAAVLFCSRSSVYRTVHAYRTGQLRWEHDAHGRLLLPVRTTALLPTLRRSLLALLKLGLVQETVPAFVQSSPAPVAFVSFDLDLYSSTRDALKVFEADERLLLPRVLCYFDDILGLTYSDYTGERLAIAEFNATHAMRKLSPLYGLKYYVPAQVRDQWWTECFYFLHIFDHVLYNHPDEMRTPMYMNVDGTLTGFISTQPCD